MVYGLLLGFKTLVCYSRQLGYFVQNSEFVYSRVNNI
jgi:hypothetical protein